MTMNCPVHGAQVGYRYDGVLVCAVPSRDGGMCHRRLVPALRVSDRDREILTVEVAEEIAALRPVIAQANRMGVDWRPTFEKAAARHEAAAARGGHRGRVEAGWAVAHRLLLDEAAGQ